MKQSMKKAALVLMLALAVLLVPQWSNTALAVTTPSDITTGSDLPPAPPLPTPPAKGEVVISGAKTVRGGEKLTFSVTIDGKTVPNSDLEWTLYPADASLATIKSGVITTKRVTYTHYVQVSAALKSDPSRYANFRLCIAPGVKKITVSAPTTYVDLSGSKTLQLKATCDPEDAIADVTWSSSSSKIATVDASGLVTARKTGKVTITATAKDGSKVKGSITLRVVSGVTGLTIEGAGSVAAGKSITLKAVMMPADATEKGVVWSVDCDKSIASISQSGKLTTKKVSGITTITVTAVSKQNSAIRATHTVTIRPVTTGLAISAPRLTIDLASPTLQLTAKCIPEDASQQVAWSTSNKRIATVDANGLVTAKKVGKVTITAKATDGSGRSAKITLTVGSAVGTLEIRGASAVAQGKTITLNAVITPATATNQKVIWSVDCGKDIATIDRHGRLKAGKGFTAPVTIMVTAVSAENSAITATRTVQILPPVTTVAISAPRNYIDVDGEDKTLQLTARVLPEDAAQSVTWSTSNKRIATVDANGVVTALKAGTVTITATATDGTGVRAKFTVKVQKTVKSLTISGAEKLGGGQSTTIKATILPKDAANQKVIYSLNCPASVATISTSGVLTTKNVTEITTVTVNAVSAENSTISATWTLVIYPKTTKLTLTAASSWINVGASAQLHVSATPETAQMPVRWRSSNTRVATVDANGVVRGLKAGTATITVRTTDGSNKRASVRVTVGIPATGVVITGNRIVRAGATLRLMATVQPANATVKRVTWAVNCPASVATISGDGKLRVSANAETQIVLVTATVNDGQRVSAAYPVYIQGKAPVPPTPTTPDAPEK